MTEQKHDQFNNKIRQKQPGIQFQVEEQPPVQALIIVPDFSKNRQTPAQTINIPLKDQIEEAEGLAKAIDLSLSPTLTIPLDTIRPSTLFGSGKVEELKHKIHQEETELVIIDTSLSPGQQRNLERAWHVKILDRTALILEIFGRRAATREGRLQVDLAHLTYQKSRLVRSWTHLERQRGGSGFLGGPGETQLESDKRQLQTRIIALTKELEKVKKTRELHRQKRRKVPYPIIALVGYTNAGKSTLFNHLTGAKVKAKDQLFATLDPTMRSIELPGGTKAIISDTVGFISNLPTQLVASFRATLEEVLEADLILHVEDISNENRDLHRKEVLSILKDLGLNKDKQPQIPIITLWNKSDLLPNTLLDDEKETEALSQTSDSPMILSAITGEGIDELLKEIELKLKEKTISLSLSLTPDQGAILSWLYDNAEITQGESTEEGATNYKITIPQRLAGKLEKMIKLQK